MAASWSALVALLPHTSRALLIVDMLAYSLPVDIVNIFLYHRLTHIPQSLVYATAFVEHCFYRVYRPKNNQNRLNGFSRGAECASDCLSPALADTPDGPTPFAGWSWMPLGSYNSLMFLRHLSQPISINLRELSHPANR